MVQNVNIDASVFAEEFSVDSQDIKQFVNNVVGELAAEYARYWDKQADILKSSRIEYKQGIYLNQVNDSTYEVGLVGWLPNAIEQGLEAFDEKEGFARSNKRTITETGGWYLTIPYRQAVPGSIGESSVFTGVMPSEVYKEAKKLQPEESLDVKKIPEQYQVPKVRPRVITKSKVFEEYQNKASIYANIKRKQDTQGRGTYVTFRRVSNNSDENSWIHTGINARNFAEKALEEMNIEDTVFNLAEKYVEQL
jgi:hypothetical protein